MVHELIGFVSTCVALVCLREAIPKTLAMRLLHFVRNDGQFDLRAPAWPLCACAKQSQNISHEIASLRSQ